MKTAPPWRRGRWIVLASVTALLLPAPSAWATETSEPSSETTETTDATEAPNLTPEVSFNDNHDGTGTFTISPLDGMKFDYLVEADLDGDGTFESAVDSGKVKKRPVVVKLSNDGEPFTMTTVYQLAYQVKTDDGKQDVVPGLEYRLNGVPVPAEVYAECIPDSNVLPITIDYSKEPSRVLEFYAEVNGERLQLNQNELQPGDVFKQEVEVPAGESVTVITSTDSLGEQQHLLECAEQKQIDLASLPVILERGDDRDEEGRGDEGRGDDRADRDDRDDRGNSGNNGNGRGNDDQEDSESRDDEQEGQQPWQEEEAQEQEETSEPDESEEPVVVVPEPDEPIVEETVEPTEEAPAPPVVEPTEDAPPAVEPTEAPASQPAPEVTEETSDAVDPPAEPSASPVVPQPAETTEPEADTPAQDTPSQEPTTRSYFIKGKDVSSETEREFIPAPSPSESGTPLGTVTIGEMDTGMQTRDIVFLTGLILFIVAAATAAIVIAYRARKNRLPSAVQRQQEEEM